MRNGRRLTFLTIGSICLTMFLVILVPIRIHFNNKYTTEKNTEMTIEEVIQTCHITICTPCQYLRPDGNGEMLRNDSDETVQLTQFKLSPPPKTTKLEELPSYGADRIEKIIHQKWNTQKVPIQFRKYIQSFIANHFSWKYMFWTDKIAITFIKDHYPYILSLYDNYVHPLNRADSIRYMILFYYGGLYSDLDTQSLGPLDPMIKKYSCFLAQEPHVHSIVYTNFYEQASNGIMACRKRHPFMKSVIENLQDFFFYANELDSTGPRFLTYSLRQYLKQNAGMETTDNDYVYLTPPEYFLPTVDPGMNKLLAKQCRVPQCLGPLRLWQCEQWRKEGVRSQAYTFSLTNHVWSHIAYQDTKSLTYIDIFDICPGASIYE